MKFRTPLVMALVLLGVLAGSGWVVSRSVRGARMQLHPPRQPVQRPADLTGLPGLSDVTLTTSDGVTLKGWYIPSRNRAAVVLSHGVGENRTQMLFEARQLVRAGYGALLYDSRGHGESGGDICTWGDLERMDFTAALDFLARQPDVDPARIGAAGFSMGGAVSILMAAKDARVKAVAALASFATLEDELRWDYHRYGPLSTQPALWTFAHEGVRVDELRPIDVVCRISPRPVLFVGGTQDPYVLPEQQRRHFHAACEPKAFWEVQGAGHGGYDKVAGEEYARRLVTFFDGALGSPRP